MAIVNLDLIVDCSWACSAPTSLYSLAFHFACSLNAIMRSFSGSSQSVWVSQIILHHQQTLTLHCLALFPAHWWLYCAVQMLCYSATYWRLIKQKLLLLHDERIPTSFQSRHHFLVVILAWSLPQCVASPFLSVGNFNHTVAHCELFHSQSCCFSLNYRIHSDSALMGTERDTGSTWSTQLWVSSHYTRFGLLQRQ